MALLKKITIDIRPERDGVRFVAHNAFPIKNALKARGYVFHDLSLGGGTGRKTWEKKFTTTEAIKAENKFFVENAIAMTRNGKVIDPVNIVTG